MSTSDALDFEPWLKASFAEAQGFTALVVLVEIGEDTVTPVASTYFHLIGDELTWTDFAGLLARAGQAWNGVVVYPTRDDDGGPVPDYLARIKLREAELKLGEDRIHLNDGAFFDNWGRRLRIEEAAKPVQ